MQIVASRPTPEERFLLGAVLIAGRLPDITLKLEDFSPGWPRRTWRAAVELAQWDQPINALSVWRQDPEIDPTELTAVVSNFPADLPARHVALYASAFESAARRQSAA